MTQQADRDKLLQIDEACPLTDQILDEVLGAVRSGRPLSLEAYYQRYPELAGELRMLLPAMLLMENPRKPYVEPISQAVGEASVAARSITQPVLTDYAIVSEIGRGAMGVVYEAIQLPLKRRVALKVLFQSVQPSEKYSHRFQREAEIAARLHHSNIVPVYEAGESEGCYYYAMQLIEGHNLLQLIEASGRDSVDQQSRPTINSLFSHAETIPQHGKQQPHLKLLGSQPLWATRSSGIDYSPEVCAGIVLQVAEGLHFAHQRSILHRDIKPSNIIIDREGRAWIADFGLAKADDNDALTDANDVVGTIRYLAPERFQGQCDHLSDIYALGVTLYEALHRRPFWPATCRAHLVQQIINGQYSLDSKRPFDCSKDLRLIVEKSTHREPAQRYQTASELAEDLRRYLDGRPVLARQPSVFYKSYQWIRCNPVISSMAALLLLIATASAMVTANLSHRANVLRAESLRNFENAKRNLDLLLETVDRVCLSLGQDQRLNRPEFQELRHQLLQMVIDFNYQFDGIPEIAREMRYLTARANVRLGSLTRGDDTLAESADHLESARVILEELHQTAPARVELDLELARCLRELALVEWKMGLRESAFQRNALAIELCESFGGDEESDDDAQFELARTRLVMGGFLTGAGSRDEAEIYYLQAVELLERLNAKYPNDRNYTAELGNAHCRLGHNYLANLRYWRKAENSLARAAEILKLADTLDPGNPDLTAKRARVLELQAKFSFVSGQRADAVTKMESACSLLAKLAQLHSNVADYRSQYAFCMKQMVVYRRALNQIDPLVGRYIQDAIKEFTWLTAHDPLHIRYRVGLSETHVSHAEILSSQGQWQQAIEILDSAMTILDELEFVEPMDKAVQDQRYFILCMRAELHANLHRFDESLADWDWAISLAADGFRDINRIQRLRTVVLSGDFVRGIAELDVLIEKISDSTNGRQHYLGEAARVLAIAHRAAVNDASTEEILGLAEGWAKRAVESLRQLLASGKLSLDFTESNEDYASLRPRADFQEVLQAARQKPSLP